MRTLLHTLVVEGETFQIFESGDQYEYDWVGGRHQGDYGFVSAPSSGTLEETREDHHQAVVDFLAEIDPTTGYLAEGSS